MKKIHILFIAIILIFISCKPKFEENQIGEIENKIILSNFDLNYIDSLITEYDDSYYLNYMREICLMLNDTTKELKSPNVFILEKDLDSLNYLYKNFNLILKEMIPDIIDNTFGIFNIRYRYYLKDAKVFNNKREYYELCYDENSYLHELEEKLSYYNKNKLIWPSILVALSYISVHEFDLALDILYEAKNYLNNHIILNELIVVCYLRLNEIYYAEEIYSQIPNNYKLKNNNRFRNKFPIFQYLQYNPSKHFNINRIDDSSFELKFNINKKYALNDTLKLKLINYSDIDFYIHLEIQSFYENKWSVISKNGGYNSLYFNDIIKSKKDYEFSYFISELLNDKKLMFSNVKTSSLKLFRIKIVLVPKNINYYVALDNDLPKVITKEFELVDNNLIKIP